MSDILNLSEALVPPTRGKFCVNCGTRMDGEYCSNCGSKGARPKWHWVVGGLIAFFTLIAAITHSTNNQAVQQQSKSVEIASAPAHAVSAAPVGAPYRTQSRNNQALQEQSKSVELASDPAQAVPAAPVGAPYLTYRSPMSGGVNDNPSPEEMESWIDQSTVFANASLAFVGEATSKLDSANPCSVIELMRQLAPLQADAELNRSRGKVMTAHAEDLAVYFALNKPYMSDKMVRATQLNLKLAAQAKELTARLGSLAGMCN